MLSVIHNENLEPVTVVDIPYTDKELHNATHIYLHKTMPKSDAIKSIRVEVKTITINDKNTYMLIANEIAAYEFKAEFLKGQKLNKGIEL